MSFEQQPDPIESADQGPDAFPALEAIQAHASKVERSMLAGEMHLSTLLNGITPKNPQQEELLASLTERAKELAGPREDVKNAAREAALSVAIKGMVDSGEGSAEKEALLAAMLKDNPEAAETLIRGVLGAAQGLRIAGPGDSGHHVDHTHLADEAKAILDELESSDKKIFKGLALRTAERIARAVISASTLGLGGIAYDTFKDVYASMQARKQIREKRKTLLMSSGAAV